MRKLTPTFILIAISLLGLLGLHLGFTGVVFIGAMVFAQNSAFLLVSGGPLMAYIAEKWAAHDKRLEAKCPGCEGTGEERSGVCHCGMPMDGHTPYDNHTPTEMTRRCEICVPKSPENRPRVCCDCQTYQSCLRMPEDPACSSGVREG